MELQLPFLGTTVLKQHKYIGLKMEACLYWSCH